MRSRSLKNILFRNHGKISGNFKGNQILLSNIIYPEFCKELGKKSSEHRMNTGVQSFFEMHRSVVFFTHF